MSSAGPTMIQVDFWNLVLLLCLFFACVGIFGRLMLAEIDKRLDERFKAQEVARTEGSTALRKSIEDFADVAQESAKEVARLERDFLRFLAQLPIDYTRREDAIRDRAVLEAKIDAVYAQIRVLQLKGNDDA